MYIIYLTSTTHGSHRHIWSEGGQFLNKKAAEFQAGQIQEMRNRYSEVAVVTDAGGRKFAMAKAVLIEGKKLKEELSKRFMGQQSLKM